MLRKAVHIMTLPTEHRLIVRFAAKAFANLGAGIAGVISVMIVARSLGPAGYGRYDFLLTAFQQITSALDTGSSTCFFTKLTQRRRDFGLVRFYWLFALGGGAAILATVAILVQTPLAGTLWAGEVPTTVLLAALLACVLWWQQITRYMVDAHGLTVRGEMLFLAHRAVALGALALLAFWDWLTLERFLMFQVTMAALLAAIWWGLLGRSGAVGGTESRSAREYITEFWTYSHPLLAYALVGAGSVLAERWILQTYVGAADQGYYALAFQVGAACAIFTTAIAQLLTREFSSAAAANDTARVAALFSRYVPMMYAVAAFMSVFVAMRAADVVRIVGGRGYVDAIPVMAVLALYPMHQAYGQLSGSLLFATGRTATYRNIGIAGMAAGLPLAYWLMVPESSGGLGMGAAGLAIKALVLQAVVVNVQLYFNTRQLGLGFLPFVLHQACVPLLLWALAWLATWATRSAGLGGILELVAAGGLYTAAAAAFVWLLPRLAGANREDLGRLARR